MFIFALLYINFSFGLEIDVNTFSNYLDVQNKHIHFELLSNMEKKQINATANYKFHVARSSINKICLDIKELNIYSIYMENGLLLRHIIDNPYADSDQGQRLNILLNREYRRGEIIMLSIKYSIDSRSESVSFMNVSQTSTKSMPFLFTQCEDAYCRSLAPLQDTPAIKQTYSATIITRIQKQQMFLQQFKIQNHPEIDPNFTWKYKYFLQKIPIPSYLIAIVAGNLQKVPTSNGDRTFLISEPDKINEYKEELKDMEQFLQAIEQYIGPYTWGTYTIVILPPSFPYGAMENPLLTFASPTIMTKTGSGLYVAIHEMAHSWFGNTVTCVNWGNMWINEGFTVFLERKASSFYYKVPDDIKLKAIIGNASMYADILNFGPDSNFTSLHPDTTGINPQLSISDILYEKGFQFLTFLEGIIGEEDFKYMLRSYLATYMYKSIDQQELQNFIIRYLYEQHVDNYSTKRYQILEYWDSWIYQPGLPPIRLDFSTNKLVETQQYTTAYILADGQQPDHYADYFNFYPSQKKVFLEELFKKAQNKELTQQVIEQIDKDLKLTNENDCELKFRWFKAILTARDRTRFTQISDFLGSVGTCEISCPVYQALNELDHEFAVQTFRTYQEFYHQITRQSIKRILEKNSQIKQ
ncbi:unnamed protein product (macronuclear) [Paramecium tetraurelia]|uniref:Peptidase M1 leukotriene A4 hydrolase/aminopeptidase C-terminal domain-containing protein n=1 Tax=Paramecium tetraurelia TaxID=5888 RepID=A0BWG8_PARTE|nr:uncharacterized protein GSPATT00032737001 [Paramecium tetraurelia]CAK62885.1 unnamed protein product [Paramecium tetraurelia]|eukprot:XP_001430283.1 hypothetical protein (macronuclear) [Paramecium tetraurelia strain d4-2]